MVPACDLTPRVSWCAPIFRQAGPLIGTRELRFEQREMLADFDGPARFAEFKCCVDSADNSRERTAASLSGDEPTHETDLPAGVGFVCHRLGLGLLLLPWLLLPLFGLRRRCLRPARIPSAPSPSSPRQG